MKIYAYIIGTIIVLSGCAHTFPVYEYGVDSNGKNMYTVNIDSFSMAKAQNTAIKTAHEYCHKKNLKMNPVQESNRPTYSSLSISNQSHHVQLIFKCL